MKKNVSAGQRPVPQYQPRVLSGLIAGLFCSSALLPLQEVLANPAIPQVVSGSASFQNNGNLLTINSSNGAIINWQSFSINPDEITRFIQPNAASSVLNRVQGNLPSQILGALQSNGKVFLINPNGILFGPNSRIDVQGLIASSLNISNDDFAANRLRFNGNPNAGSIQQQGTITTPSGGKVFLLAPNVENHGLIQSPQGDVLLAAGHSVQLVDSADPNLQVVVNAPQHQVVNLGRIIAQGGRIGIYGALVNQRGSLNADSAVMGENGKIVLKASRSTTLEAGSQVSATNSAGTGGDVSLQAPLVVANGNASVDASGATGGGSILFGGDYHGANPAISNADQVFFG